jgi:glycosyltransferase involved in cell wall biosynthesis
MAKAVRMLADDAELAASMGAAAKTRAQQCFSPEASVAKYVDFYRRVLAECTQ